MITAHWPRGHLIVTVGLAAATCGTLVFLLAWHVANGETRSTAGNGEYLTKIGPKRGLDPADGGTGEASGTHAAGGRKLAAQDLVRTQAVEAVVRHETLRLTGSLEPDEKSDVGSNAQGNVWQTCVDRGSFVKKGDLLVQLDSRDAQYALDEGLEAAEQLRVRLGLDEAKEFRLEDVPEVEGAKLTLELAQRIFKRDESLRKQNAVALETYDQAATEYRSAVQRYHLTLLQGKQAYRAYRAALTHLVTLRKAVEDCSIRAPFDGYVAERNVSVGERVIAMFPGAKLVTILRIDPLRLMLTVPQQDIGHVRAGQGVMFQADSFPGRTFHGTVRYITPAVTADSRSLLVEALVPNPGAVLRPGLFVTAELELAAQRTDLFVRSAAVCQRGDVAAVFVLRGGVVREQIVSLGEASGQRVRILAGLAAGEAVVTTPELVHDGDREGADGGRQTADRSGKRTDGRFYPVSCEL